MTGIVDAVRAALGLSAFAVVANSPRALEGLLS